MARFHGERPGITEAVLSRTSDRDGRSAYAWLADAVNHPGPAVDVGCGSGPMCGRVQRWVGLDLTLPEVRVAHEAGRMPVVAARAEALPLAAASARIALAVMSLMVVDQPAGTLEEIARVLREDGRLVALLPTDRPLTSFDRARYGLLLAAIGRTALPFPHLDLVRNPTRTLEAAGFKVLADERRRFVYPMHNDDDADELVASLYLPGVSPRRIGAARAVARRWGRRPLGIPLRRIIASPASQLLRPPDSPVLDPA